MESKLSYIKTQRVAKRFKYDGYIVVEAIGKSGGLMLLWKWEELVGLVNYSQNHINVVVNDE